MSITLRATFPSAAKAREFAQWVKDIGAYTSVGEELLAQAPVTTEVDGTFRLYDAKGQLICDPIVRPVEWGEKGLVGTVELPITSIKGKWRRIYVATIVLEAQPLAYPAVVSEHPMGTWNGDSIVLNFGGN